MASVREPGQSGRGFAERPARALGRIVSLLVVAAMVGACEDPAEVAGEASSDAGVDASGGQGGASGAGAPTGSTGLCLNLWQEHNGACESIGWRLDAGGGAGGAAGAGGDGGTDASAGVLGSDCLLPLELGAVGPLRVYPVVAVDCQELARDAEDPYGWDLVGTFETPVIAFGEQICGEIRTGLRSSIVVLILCGSDCPEGMICI
jgi:hypothetical protein